MPREMPRLVSWKKNFHGKPRIFTRQILRGAMRVHACKSEVINERYCRWTWFDMRPISIVRDQGLRELLGFIEPNYQLPSTTHVSALIRKDFEDGRDALTLQLCGHTIALTTDIWTSKATQSFAMTTAHFLDKEWKLTSCVLETIHFPGNHTAIRISEKLQEVLCPFNIGSEQVSAIVHDEALNAILAGMFYVFKLKIV